MGTGQTPGIFNRKHEGINHLPLGESGERKGTGHQGGQGSADEGNEDPERGKPSGSVKLVKEKEYRDDTKKYWDTVTVWKGIMMDYNMMVKGNSEISKAVEKLVRYK